MKIHSNTLTHDDVYNACKATGMSGVYLDQYSEHGSRSRTRRLDVKLVGSSSNRAVNAGTSRYADRGESAERAATWDEWGIFINALFLVDPEAIISYYESYADFKRHTCNRFDTLVWADQHVNHHFDDRPGDYTARCKCGAVQDWSSHYNAA